MAAPILATICAERFAKMVAHHSRTKPFVLGNNATQSSLMTCLKVNTRNQEVLQSLRKELPTRFVQQKSAAIANPLKMQSSELTDKHTPTHWHSWLDFFALSPKSLKHKEKISARKARHSSNTYFDRNMGIVAPILVNQKSKWTTTSNDLTKRNPKANGQSGQQLLNDRMKPWLAKAAMPTQSTLATAVRRQSCTFAQRAHHAFAAGKPFMSQPSQSAFALSQFCSEYQNTLDRIKLYRACF